MINLPEYYDILEKMSPQEREEILDPICVSVHGKREIEEGLELRANRIFALAVLDLYEKWQKEVYYENGL